MQNLYKLLLTLILSLSVFSISAHDLKGAISSEDRTPANKLRDSERNPYETLSFFGIESDMTVVEFLLEEVGIQKFLLTTYIILEH